MSKPKIRGYLYEIVEMYPGQDGDHGIRYITTHDRLEDATKVLEVLESVNYNWTTYALMMRPVWEDEAARREAKQQACDHSGSSSSLSLSGQFVFNCPKCGKHIEYPGWDANGSPVEENPF